MEDALASAVASADGPWPVLAIAIIGLYVLLWRFGGKLLTLSRDSNQVANDAHEEVKAISSSIVTNHGSKNIGDAVDRLTELVWGIDSRMTAGFARVDERVSKLEDDS